MFISINGEYVLSDERGRKVHVCEMKVVEWRLTNTNGHTARGHRVTMTSDALLP